MSYLIGEEYWELEPETHRFSAKEWHGKYKMDCFKIFEFTCSTCYNNIGLGEGVVHHKTYKHKGGIYQALPHEIKDKICLMCHDCHTKEHQTKSIDGLTKILPVEKEYNSCLDCGELQDKYCTQLVNGRCELCNDVYNETMSKYLF